MTLPSQTVDAKSDSYGVLDTWSGYRRIFSGYYQREVIAEHLSRVFPQTWKDGAMPVRYANVIQFLAKKTACSFGTPLLITADKSDAGTLRQQFRAWRLALEANWHTAAAAKSSYLHLALRGNNLELDQLSGDEIEVVADQTAPTTWEYIRECRIAMPDGGRLVYRRDDSGDVFWHVTDRTGEKKTDEVPYFVPKLMPIYQTRRAYSNALRPEPDRAWLDLHLAVAEILSHVDHRRMYKTDKVVVTSGTATAGKVTPVEMPAGMHYAWQIEEGGTAIPVSQPIDSVNEIAYVLEFLRFCVMMMDLPSEIIVPKSRAETGAAKEIDYSPVVEAQEVDRDLADEWLLDFVTWVSPALRERKILTTSGFSAKVVPPRRVNPVDQTTAQALEILGSLGLIDLAKELAKRDRTGIGLASENLMKNAKLFRQLKEVSSGSQDKVPVDPQAP